VNAPIVSKWAAYYRCSCFSHHFSDEFICTPIFCSAAALSGTTLHKQVVDNSAFDDVKQCPYAGRSLELATTAIPTSLFHDM